MRRKVGCPKKGCNYFVEAESAEDAMEDLREHFQDEHDMDDIPDEMKKEIGANIKGESKKRL